MSAVGQVTPLSRTGDEFGQIHHALQLSCRSTGVKDVSIWAISNPHLNIQFERRSQALMTVDCWVDINALDEDNSIQEVCKRGFHVVDTAEGLVFATGNIRFDANGPDTHQYLLCTVAVGRPFVQDDPSAKRELPAGYDSIYLHSSDAEIVGDPEYESYRHTYVVFDSAQVLPKYVVHFRYDPTERMHRAVQPPINLSDIKQRVAETLAVLGPMANLTTEKMLSDIGEAYEAAITASQEHDVVLEDRKRTIRDTVKAIDDKLRAVQANSAAVEEALYQKLQEALHQLQDETQRKMNLLLSEELELRRQLQQIDWSEGFIHVMQQTLPPTSFIAAWERHAALRSSLYAHLSSGRIASRVLEEVQPDMRLVGHIEVMTERAAAHATGAHAAATGGPSASAGRLFGVTPAPKPAGLGAMTDPFQIAPSQAGGSVSDIWTNQLRAQMGLPSAASTTTAEANLALARANAAAVEAVASAVPKSLKATTELALAETHARLSEAEAMMRAERQAATVAAAAAASVEQESKQRASHAASALPRGSSTTGLSRPEQRRPSQPNSAPVANPTALSAAAAPRPAASLEDRISRFSLRKEAERKQRQSNLTGPDVAQLAFPGSTIISADQAANLYMCLPFGSGFDDGGLGLVPPSTRLVYTVKPDSVSTVENFMMTYQANAQQADGSFEPTVLIIKANGHVFGGFAADGWDFTDNYGGSPHSFLFSITRDCKVPYHGRVKGPKQANDDFLRQLHEHQQIQAQQQFESYVQAQQMAGMAPQYDEQGRLLATIADQYGNPTDVLIPVPRPRPFVRHDCLKSSSTSLQFGLKDLVLSGNFSSCSSELEYSYGIGLKPGSTEAKTLLAGAPLFNVEAMEIWAVFSDVPQTATDGSNMGHQSSEGAGYR